LLFDLAGFNLGNVPVATAFFGQKPVGIVDGAFATFDGYIHFI